MALQFGHGSYDPNENKGPMLVKVCAMMMGLSTIGICGRFMGRRLTKQPILWDDWLIVVAWVFAWACCIIEIIGVYIAYFGRHAQFATPESTIRYFKLLYMLQIVYPLAIAPIKFSMILFYRRIFSVPQTVKPSLLLAALVTGWLIGTLLPAIFDCQPIYAFWDTEVPHTCIDSLRYFLGIAIPNVVTDVLLLIFPIPWIWKLVMPTSQKIALSGIFLLGGFVIVISTLRLITLVESQGQMDFTRSLIPLAEWNVVETNVGIFLACLPSMRPLLRVLLGQKLESQGRK